MAIERIRELSFTRRETMKKQIVNNKVLRGVAIAMSAMMAITSVPIGAFAADEEGQSTEETVTIEDGIEACGVIDEMTSRDEDNEGQSEIEVVVFETMNETYSIDDDQVAEDLAMVLWDQEENDRIGIINQDVSDFNDELSTIKNNLDTADKGLSEKVDAFVGDLNTIDENEKKVSGNLENLKSNVNIANTSTSSSEAGNATNAAQNNLNNIEKDVKDAQKALTDAGNDVVAATNEYNTVKEIYDSAQKDLETAKANLENAEGNATAANEHMKAAQARVDSLAGRLEKLGANKEASIANLEAIQKQYYAMQVQYYRDALGSKAVYNADGTLNIEKCAEQISDDKVNEKAAKQNKQVMELGRYLMEQLIAYKLSNDENIDPETIKIGTKDLYASNEKPKEKTAREGMIFRDNKNQDQNNAEDKTRTDYNGETVQIANTKKIYTLDSGENFGRTNRLRVTYKDKNGVDHTEYYNYIFKKSDGNCNDTLDLKKGMIYLADISQNEDGTLISKKDDSVYSFDNYQELVAVIETLKDPSKFAEYQKELSDAKEAADKAAAEVQKLYDEVEKLKKVNISREKLDAAVRKLEEAQERYGNAEEKVGQLEEQLKEAERLINTIDRSRTFEDEDDDDDDTSDGGDTVAAGGTTTLQLGTFDNAVSITTGTVLGTRTAGVAGVRVNDADNNAAGNDQVVQIDNIATPKEAAPASSDSKESTEKTIVKVSNPETPLAATPFEEGTNMNWLWLLGAAAAAGAGAYGYGKHRKKVAANEEAKKYKK